MSDACLFTNNWALKNVRKTNFTICDIFIAEIRIYLVDFPHTKNYQDVTRVTDAESRLSLQKIPVNSPPLFVPNFDSGPQCGVILKNSKKWPQRVFGIVPLRLRAAVGQNGSGVRKKMWSRGDFRSDTGWCWMQILSSYLFVQTDTHHVKTKIQWLRQICM